MHLLGGFQFVSNNICFWFFSIQTIEKVEYAIEAINNAGTCVGILAKNGIVMASERRITSGLLAPAKVREEKYAIVVKI